MSENLAHLTTAGARYKARKVLALSHSQPHDDREIRRTDTSVEVLKAIRGKDLSLKLETR